MNDTHNNAGRFDTTSEMATKRARIVELHDDGKTFKEIADELGYANKGAAFAQYRKALADIPSPAVAEYRANETVRLLTNIARLEDALTDAKDPVDVTTVCREIRRHSESLRRLHGTDAPTKTSVTVITQDVVDAEIERLQQEMAELDASADTHA